jgi:hypothetical protein
VTSCRAECLASSRLRTRVLGKAPFKAILIAEVRPSDFLISGIGILWREVRQLRYTGTSPVRPAGAFPAPVSTDELHPDEARLTTAQAADVSALCPHIRTELRSRLQIWSGIQGE